MWSNTLIAVFGEDLPYCGTTPLLFLFTNGRRTPVPPQIPRHVKSLKLDLLSRVPCVGGVLESPTPTSVAMPGG